MTDANNTPANSTARAPRKLPLKFGAGALTLAAIALVIWQRMPERHLQSTDDAYVNGHLVTITPQVAGAVTALMADNADRVQAGALLARIDDSDARIAVAAAQAEVALARRHVAGLFAAQAQAAALVQLRQTELESLRDDLHVRQSIVAQGAVSAEETRHAADAVKSAQAALVTAQRAHAATLTQTQGSTETDHPELRMALEKLRTASLALERTQIHAPVAGMIAQRNVQLGKRVTAGERLMAVVPLDQLWVDANFKEVQLKNVCKGQIAHVTADVYGHDVHYRGVVQNIEAGSGAAFSLLPAQNATGNWIKVVQRVPVRIRLNAEDLARHPLRIGMSMEVEIDTSACPSGTSDTTRATESTALYAQQQQAADANAMTAAEQATGVQ